MEGDEWKYRRSEAYDGPMIGITRAQEQARIDILYAAGEITQEQWRSQTEDLGNPRLWTATGKVDG